MYQYSQGFKSMHPIFFNFCKILVFLETFEEKLNDIQCNFNVPLKKNYDRGRVLEPFAVNLACV